VKDLLKRGIWKRIRDGKHPIYEAVPGNQIPGGPFSANEQAVIAAIRGGKAVTSELKSAAEALAARSLTTAPAGQRQTVKINEAAIAAFMEPLAVWLPNTLIDGAANEVPPIELVRQTRSLPALRLLIELYAVQFLPNYSGVPRDVLKGVFERAKVGEQGPFVVWGFRPKTMSACHSDLARQFWTGQFKKTEDGTRRDTGWDGSFFPAVDALVGLGLVERVGMLLDGDDAEAEIIHPFARDGGEPVERELALAAQDAALAMVTEGQLNWAFDEGYSHLVPVRKHITKVAMVEVYRLKYRPHTKATGAWYAMMQNTTTEYIGRYRAMINDRAAALA
jgi:hypothetical protein